MDWTEIGKWIGGIIAAAVATGLVFKFAFVRKSSKTSRTVTQTNNRAGRDIVGGDSIDNSKR